MAKNEKLGKDTRHRAIIKAKRLNGLTANQLRLLRELRDDHGGVLTLRSRADRSDYEALKKRGCIEILPLFLTDIRCEITEVGRDTLLKYGIRTG